MKILFALTVAAKTVALTTAESRSLSGMAPTDYVYTCDGVKTLLSDVNDLLENSVCDEQLNCAPYSYDNSACLDEPEVCPASGWYENGRENFRCSVRDGGVRIGRTAWTNPCQCYEDCKEMASEADETLVAFDYYSDKCRCWGGSCDDQNSRPCFNGGDAPDDPSGNNWRCPSEIYYPIEKYDCDGRDITFMWDSVKDYIGDGFCDNGLSLASIVAGSPYNFDCDAFDHDDGDCNLECNTAIYWETDFAELSTAFYQVDCTSAMPMYETSWEGPCQCYEHCAEQANDVDLNFVFDRSSSDTCRCFLNIPELESTPTSFCGFDSQCQIYQTQRESTCERLDGHVHATDYTLGLFEIYPNHYVPYSDADKTPSSSVEAQSVTSFASFTEGRCMTNTMCQKNSWSNGECFECSRFAVERHDDAYCENSDYGISIYELQDLIDDGYLMGDVSTDGDNCACANFCFSNAIEYYHSVNSLYQLLQVASPNDMMGRFAYEIKDNVCQCTSNCTLIECDGILDEECGSGSTVFFPAVADLNVQSQMIGDQSQRFEYYYYF